MKTERSFALLLQAYFTERLVETFDDYRKKALYYYNNRKKLTALKKKVAQKVRSSALFRPDIFAVDLENQYRIINAKHNI